MEPTVMTKSIAKPGISEGSIAGPTTSVSVVLISSQGKDGSDLRITEVLPPLLVELTFALH